MADVASKLTRLNTAKGNIKTAIEGKGRDLTGKTLENDWADEIAAIETGEQTTNPTIVITEFSSNTVKYTVKNNDTEKAKIWVDVDTTPPTTEILELDPDETSSEQEFTGLDPDTEYTFYFQVGAYGKLKSEILSKTRTMDDITQVNSTLIINAVYSTTVEQDNDTLKIV